MLKNVIPESIKFKIKQTLQRKLNLRGDDEYYEHYVKQRMAIEALIPKVSLDNQHIRNIKILLDRTELLKQLPKNSICAEIGVDRGEFSEQIITHTNPQKLHLIDAWGDQKRYHDGLRNEVIERYGQEIEHGSMVINHGYSTEVLEAFPNAYFDWVYLDTDHTYKLTSEELKLLKHKVKPDGIIAGHDYTIGNWVAGYRYGVIEAVHEFCVIENYEIIYLTMETHQFRSFAIRKVVG